MHAVKKCTD